MFLFPSATDTFGQVILEAQASGLPVVAVARGGPLSLIEDRVSGLLCEPDAERARGRAVLELARSPLLRERLAGAALRAARTRTWEHALARLADGYRPGAPARPRAERPHAGVGRPGARLSAVCAQPEHASRSETIAVAAARDRAGDVRALRADPRLARRPRRRPRHAARDPGARPAPGRRALPGDDRLAGRAPARGDSIAQHGFQHVHLRRGSFPGRRLARTRGRRAAEFVGLDGEETRRAVDAGWRVLKLAGVEPDGFVAPAYAYTPALRSVLPRRFRWWAGLLRLHRTFAAPDGNRAQRLAPAWDIGTDGPLRRVLSPGLIRAGSLLSGENLRLDLHPADLQHPRHMLALEWVLGRAGQRREAITFEELVSAWRVGAADPAVAAGV